MRKRQCHCRKCREARYRKRHMTFWERVFRIPAERHVHRNPVERRRRKAQITAIKQSMALLFGCAVFCALWIWMFIEAGRPLY
jgi:hypothetical protein